MESIKAQQVQTAPPQANPFAPDHGRRVSKEEYWAKWYERPYSEIDVSYEWNNGILEAKPLPNAPQLRQYRWFYTLMTCYIQSRPIADMINLETGVSMTVPDDTLPSGKWEAVFKPDIGVVLNDNPAPWGAIDLRAFEGVCDLIVEKVSDSTQAEVRRDTEEKKRDYARVGGEGVLHPGPKRTAYALLPSRRAWALRGDPTQRGRRNPFASIAWLPISAFRPAQFAGSGRPGSRRSLRGLCLAWLS